MFDVFVTDGFTRLVRYSMSWIWGFAPNHVRLTGSLREEPYRTSANITSNFPSVYSTPGTVRRLDRVIHGTPGSGFDVSLKWVEASCDTKV